MTGRCHYCRSKTQAMAGPANKEKRRKPSIGFRPGWVVESSTAAFLICNVCAFRALTTHA